MNIRVILADDNEVLSELLTLELNEAPDIAVIFRASNGKEILEHLETEHGNVDVSCDGY